jgi:hypothetical protein
VECAKVADALNLSSLFFLFLPLSRERERGKRKNKELMLRISVVPQVSKPA